MLIQGLFNSFFKKVSTVIVFLCKFLVLHIGQRYTRLTLMAFIRSHLFPGWKRGPDSRGGQSGRERGVEIVWDGLRGEEGEGRKPGKGKDRLGISRTKDCVGTELSDRRGWCGPVQGSVRGGLVHSTIKLPPTDVRRDLIFRRHRLTCRGLWVVSPATCHFSVGLPLHVVVGWSVGGTSVAYDDITSSAVLFDSFHCGLHFFRTT